MTKQYDRAYFDRWYREQGFGSRAVVERKVQYALAATEYLIGRRVRRVLDVGCGEGAWQPVLRRLRPAATYVGVDPSEYAIDRFAMETKRQLHVLDQQLAGKKFLLGDTYSIADIAVYPWYGGLVLNRAYGAAEFLSAHEYSEVVRWAKEIEARPAVKRGVRVNRSGDNPPGLVKERHSARDLDL